MASTAGEAEERRKEDFSNQPWKGRPGGIWERVGREFGREFGNEHGREYGAEFGREFGIKSDRDGMSKAEFM